MPLVSAICTQCGGVVEVSAEQKDAVCRFCNTQFVTQQAINNYNVQNTIKADVVNVVRTTEDFEVRAGKLISYNGASADPVIPDNVTNIGERAFANCESLASVQLHAGIDTIGKAAFLNCRRLKKITIPDGVTYIPDHTFFGCEHLSEAVLPSTLERIGAYAFAECLRLSEAVLPESLQMIEEYAFRNCRSMSSADIPAQISIISAGVFYNCMSLTNITLGPNVRFIEPGAFELCESLTELTAENPNILVIYGNGTSPPFSGCISLKTVIVPESFDIPTQIKFFSGSLHAENLANDNHICIHCGGKLRMLQNSAMRDGRRIKYKQCRICGKNTILS